MADLSRNEIRSETDIPSRPATALSMIISPVRCEAILIPTALGCQAHNRDFWEIGATLAAGLALDIYYG